MAWIKVPPEHHPLFHAALPRDPRVETQLMFGGIAAKVNGHIFAGLFGRSTMILLSDMDREAALALDGAAPFDPMGNGRVMSGKIMLPEDTFHDPAELRAWIARAFEHVATLPRKVKPAKQATAKAVAKPPAAKATVKARAANARAKKPAAGAAASSMTKKSAAKKPAAKKPAAKRAGRSR